MTGRTGYAGSRLRSRAGDLLRGLGGGASREPGESTSRFSDQDGWGLSDLPSTTENVLRFPTMTLFFVIVALVHVFGLFAMLLASREVPAAARVDRGFRRIEEEDDRVVDSAPAHAQAHTA